MRRAIPNLLWFIAQTGLFITCWTLANNFSKINRALLPTPIEVASALREYATSGELVEDGYWSLRRAILGFIAGGILALIVGTLTGRIYRCGRLLTSIFNGLRALPPVAIVPLVVVWAGLGESAKVFITAWAAFFPIWLNTHAGVSGVDKMVIWVARSLGARGRHLLFEVTFPAALPQILVGLRLAISNTLICVIVAEMTGASAGLGYRLETSYLVFRVDRMLAVMAVLALIGIAADRAFNIVAARMYPWIKLSYDRL